MYACVSARIDRRHCRRQRASCWNHWLAQRHETAAQRVQGRAARGGAARVPRVQRCRSALSRGRPLRAPRQEPPRHARRRVSGAPLARGVPPGHGAVRRGGRDAGGAAEALARRLRRAWQPRQRAARRAVHPRDQGVRLCFTNRKKHLQGAVWWWWTWLTLTRVHQKPGRADAQRCAAAFWRDHRVAEAGSPPRP